MDICLYLVVLREDCPGVEIGHVYRFGGQGYCQCFQYFFKAKTEFFSFFGDFFPIFCHFHNTTIYLFIKKHKKLERRGEMADIAIVGSPLSNKCIIKGRGLMKLYIDILVLLDLGGSSLSSIKTAYAQTSGHTPPKVMWTR